MYQRKGLYKPPPGASDIPGLEVAGEVVAVGSAVQRFKRGDLVCALVTGGGYAEYAVANHSVTMRLPACLDVDEAAAMPETFMTVWLNLVQRGKPICTLRCGGSVRTTLTSSLRPLIAPAHIPTRLAATWTCVCTCLLPERSRRFRGAVAARLLCWCWAAPPTTYFPACNFQPGLLSLVGAGVAGIATPRFRSTPAAPFMR